MKFILFSIFIIVTTNNYAQRASFKEIKRKADTRFYNIGRATIFFPIVVTKNKTVSTLINDKIKNDFFPAEGEKLDLQLLLDDFIAGGLINLSYETTLNANGILSLKIYAESCGGHCNTWYSYYNFDLITGKPISIEDMIQSDQLEMFREKVLSEKDSTLKKWRIEEKNILDRKKIDSADYNFVIEYAEENCEKEPADLANFSLKPGYLEIIDPCEFPIIIRWQEPLYNLKYSYQFLKPFLKKEFIAKLK